LGVASDALAEAFAAARSVLADLGTAESTVVHSGNNVIVGTDRFVAKVSRDASAAFADYRLSLLAAGQHAPALAPIGPPLLVSGFTVVVWPRVDNTSAVHRVEAAYSLQAVHHAWQRFDGALPTLVKQMVRARRVSTSGVLAVVVAGEDVRMLTDAISRGIEIAASHRVLQVLHGEPHDGNFLRDSSVVVAIDFESACWGPLEWDAAFFTDEVVGEVWPTADGTLIDQLRTVISAIVSIYCWRHLAVRGPDEFMRTHAEQHLRTVRSAGP
jgi:hypothetical protein